MLALQEYESSEEEIEGTSKNTEVSKSSDDIVQPDYLNHTETNPEFSVKNKLQICAAPLVVPTGSEECIKPIDPFAKEVLHNPKYEELFAPMVGPDNPFLTQQMKADKNMLSGYIEAAHMSEFQFENQRRTFNSFGYALDPTVDCIKIDGSSYVGSVDTANETNGKTVFESTKLRPLDKRKRQRNNNPEDVAGFLGPWGGYVDEQRVMKPSEEEAVELQELLSKRHKRGKPVEEKPIEEKSVLHIKDSVDYQGRSFLHPP